MLQYYFSFLEQLFTQVRSDVPKATSKFYTASMFEMGHKMAQLVEVLHHKP
jgi:hypothetical protein